MDSCTEGEQEEFFESLEVIPSSASSENESGGEEDYEFCKPAAAAMANASVENHPVSFSRYEVWQSDSGSILERRQRLFTKMGLDKDWEDAVKTRDAHSSDRPLQSQDKVVTGLRYAVEPVNFNGVKDLLSDNGLASLQESACNTCEAEDSSFRLVLPQAHEQCTDANSAVLKSASSGHSSGRGISIGEGVVYNLSSNGNGEPLQDSASLDGGTADCMTSHDARLSLKGSLAVKTCQDAELSCRIKDLDTGKEFVVNDVGQDGSWNKLKELHSGKELTLEEFESSLGFSPIVQEVMKRERASEDGGATDLHVDTITEGEKKKRAWFKVIKGFVNSSRDKGHYRSGSNDRMGSMEKSGRRSSSESNDSHEAPLQVAKRVKVHAHKKSTKEFADLYLIQEIRAHEGVIWTMKFSFDGSLLASAGQDKVVRVWEVLDHDRLACSPSDNSGYSSCPSKGVDNLLQCQKCLKGSAKGTSGQIATLSSSTPFLLSEKPKCAFNGHAEDVLDLSWSHSQLLLSSSMDKTVRLWNVMSGDCTRIFAHNDYVTCIHFNPVDDGYFISGSLDGKVRIWSLVEHQVVDWVDLCEMVTAASYTPNGQGAVVGSYKGTCHFYKTSDSKLQLETKFEVQRKKKRRSPGKKITGFQFIPGDESKILITSSDSRIRVFDGSNISSKYKGLRNSNSQISASVSLNGMYVICASEDSRVCIWKYYNSSLNPLQKTKTLAGSYEDFLARNVTIAIPWPGVGFELFQEKSNEHSSMVTEKVVNNSETNETGCLGSIKPDKNSKHDLIASYEISPCHSTNGDSVQKNVKLANTISCHMEGKQQPSCQEGSPYSLGGLSVTSPMLNSYLEDCCSVLSKAGQDQFPFSEGTTWPEENFLSIQKVKCFNGEKGGEDHIEQKVSAITTAWGLVIVTAGLEGDIQVFQNQSLPI